AVGRARLRDAAAEHLRVVGLAYHDLRLRAAALERARDALECPARAESRDPIVEVRVGKIRENLLGRRSRMNGGGGLVLELPAQGPPMRFGELAGLGTHARSLH